MENNLTIYKAKKSVMLGGLFLLALVFLGFTLPLLIAGNPIETGKLWGLIGFWIIGVILTVLPLGAKLEVGSNYIKTYLFGFTTTEKVFSSDVKELIYGNIFGGGFGFGKGIIFRTLVDGKKKAYNISEANYGKEAVAHARRVLEQKV